MQNIYREEEGRNRRKETRRESEKKLTQAYYGLTPSLPITTTTTTTNNNNNNNNAIYIAQIRAQQQMGYRVISVQTERLSA